MSTKQYAPSSQPRGKSDLGNTISSFLGVAPDRRSLRGRSLEKESASPSSIANVSADRVQTSCACTARTSSTMPKSRRISATARSLQRLHD